MTIVSHNVCPTGTRHGTPPVTPTVRHVGACWVQNQNQNQSLYLKVSCGVSGTDRIRSNGDLQAFGFGDSR